MSVSPDVDVYTKTPTEQKTLRKTSKKRKKTTYWKLKENKYRDISNVGVHMLDLSCQGSVSHACPTSVTPLIIADCCSTPR